AGKNGLSVEPADLEAVASAEALQVIDRQGELALTDTIGRALEVGKVVARHLLMGADEQMRELSATGACLGEELRDRCLQHVLGEEKRRLERYLRCTAGWRCGGGQLEVGALVEEPFRVALKYRGQELEHFGGWRTFAALDHAQIGNRRSVARVALNAA